MIANIITGFRVLISIALMFCPVFSKAFYTLYLIAGLSDMIDGTIARGMNTVSGFGARFDTAADFAFVVASIVTVPKMNYIAVRGSGNPNDEDGEYKQAIGLLYGIAFTIKMSKKSNPQIDGYFDYVVPPLEGFWWQEGVSGIDYDHKEDFQWISVIRLPDFVSKEYFEWAVREATAKKKQNFSKVEFFTYDEGLCVQCMHIGSYDDEPATVEAMHRFMEEQGYVLDITDQRMHHEIYLSDARKVAPGKLKTVVRHPIRKNSDDTVKVMR